MKKFLKILLQAVPVMLMIALVPLIKNDYWLAGVDLVIIVIALLIKYERRDWVFLVFGFFGMIISEYIFTSTKVETFNRNSLFWANAPVASAFVGLWFCSNQTGDYYFRT